MGLARAAAPETEKAEALGQATERELGREPAGDSEQARKAKWQGTVVLSLIVDASGKAVNIVVTKSLGLGLDQKAVEAVEKWRFKPGMKGGKPVPVIAAVEMNFRLL
jgi:TonB family protein